MKKICLGITLALIAAGGPCALAQNVVSPKDPSASKNASRANASQNNEAADFVFDSKSTALNDLQDMGAKFVELAKAMPADKYAWRPNGDGLLSVSEVYLLAATEYYHLPTEMGAVRAAGYEYGGDQVTGRRQASVPLEKSSTKKEEVINQLVDGVSYFDGIMQTLSDADFQKHIKLSGHDTTPNSALIVMTGDLHEYLAVAMNYARIQGVVLPWMAEHEQEMQKRGERTPITQ